MQNGGLRRRDVQDARNQHDVRAGRWCFGQDLQRGALLGRGTAAIYNRNSYLREMTVALDLWADRLLAIVSGQASNVVSLRG